MKCPVCRAIYRSTSQILQTPDRSLEDSGVEDSSVQALSCRRCGADLAPLIQLHNQAIWYHRQAIQAFKAGNYPIAQNWNLQALALNRQNADFQALAGQLWALQGDLPTAIVAWKKAQQINPQHPTAIACLCCLDVH
jgi:tetratricopeptide (TPR) repeat protein